MSRDCIEPDSCRFEEARRVAVTAADKERGHGVDVGVEWQRVYNARADPQRLLWASTGTEDPKASDVLNVKALAASFTVTPCLRQRSRGG
jgi:hypothetical protein